MTPEEEKINCARGRAESAKQLLETVRAIPRPYSDQREQLWRETFLRFLSEHHAFPTSVADRAVIEFDKRFSR